MNCELCNNIMVFIECDGRNYWICDFCQNGYLAKPKENCEHENIIFGVNNLAYCLDCGNLLAYEKFKLQFKGSE